MYLLIHKYTASICDDPCVRIAKNYKISATCLLKANYFDNQIMKFTISPHPGMTWLSDFIPFTLSVVYSYFKLQSLFYQS